VAASSRFSPIPARSRFISERPRRPPLPLGHPLNSHGQQRTNRLSRASPAGKSYFVSPTLSKSESLRPRYTPAERLSICAPAPIWPPALCSLRQNAIADQHIALRVIARDTLSRNVIRHDLKLAELSLDAVVGVRRQGDKVSLLPPHPCHVFRVDEHDISSAVDTAKTIIFVIYRRIELTVRAHHHKFEDLFIFRRWLQGSFGNREIRLSVGRLPLRECARRFPFGARGPCRRVGFCCLLPSEGATKPGVACGSRVGRDSDCVACALDQRRARRAYPRCSFRAASSQINGLSLLTDRQLNHCLGQAASTIH
jgi:hypothetical protein